VRNPPGGGHDHPKRDERMGRVTLEEKIDETLDCPHDLACLYKFSRPVACPIDYIDGDNILFLKERNHTLCPYKLSWGTGHVCRCPTRYGVSVLFPSERQRKGGIGFWKADRNGIIFSASRSIERSLGIGHDQIIGSCVLGELLKESIGRLLPFYRRAMNIGKTVPFENVPVGTPVRSPHPGWLIPRFANREFTHMICILENTEEGNDLQQGQGGCERMPGG
jgi:hypothetical protein